MRLLFSETPLKGWAGKRGWEKDEKKIDEEDEFKRPAALTYAKGATPAKAPIIESALQQRTSASPSYTTPPVSRQRPRSSAQFTSPPSLTPATLSRINASFQQKLLQSSSHLASHPASSRQTAGSRAYRATDATKRGGTGASSSGVPLTAALHTPVKERQ